MFLLTGLGNPGQEYVRTRHNVGFIAIDYLINRYGFITEPKKKLHSHIASGQINNSKLLLSKPLTFMNLSGIAVQAITTYYRININNIFIIHDDADLPLGKIKVKLGGSSAGHNGLKSIDNCIGKNYYRIRIGIGRAANIELVNYVLAKFNADEYLLIMNSIIKIGDNLPLLIKDQEQKFIDSLKIISNSV